MGTARTPDEGRGPSEVRRRPGGSAAAAAVAAPAIAAPAAHLAAHVAAGVHPRLALLVLLGVLDRLVVGRVDLPVLLVGGVPDLVAEQEGAVGSEDQGLGGHLHLRAG